MYYRKDTEIVAGLPVVPGDVKVLFTNRDYKAAARNPNNTYFTRVLTVGRTSDLPTVGLREHLKQTSLELSRLRKYGLNVIRPEWKLVEADRISRVARLRILEYSLLPDGSSMLPEGYCLAATVPIIRKVRPPKALVDSSLAAWEIINHYETHSSGLILSDLNPGQFEWGRLATPNDTTPCTEAPIRRWMIDPDPLLARSPPA